MIRKLLAIASIALLFEPALAEQRIRDRSRDPTGGIPAQPSPLVSTGVSVHRQPLNAASSTIWTIVQIPVCWENPMPANDGVRTNIRNAIAATWEANSEIRFIGWRQCVPNSKGIRIQLGSTPGDNQVSFVRQLGSAIDGVKNGMFLNLNRTPIAPVAVHEFGHALGFAHEHGRPDSPAWCRDKPNSGVGDIFMTPWDINSVMNYCNPLANNNGQLSAHDIAGLQFWYGPVRPSGTPWVPDCRLDVVLFQDVRFGGRGVIVRGSMQELGVESFNDQTSSLCIPSGYSLTAFEDNYHRGKTITWHGPAIVIDLTKELAAQGLSWNDRVSSLKLTNAINKAEVYEAQNECQKRALIFSDWHFMGPSLILTTSVSDLRQGPMTKDQPFNDVVTSLCVPPGKTLKLFEHINFEGQSISVTGPAFIQTLNDRGWNDRASSVQIN
jgi:hypothetical protein